MIERANTRQALFSADLFEKKKARRRDSEIESRRLAV